MEARVVHRSIAALICVLVLAPPLAAQEADRLPDLDSSGMVVPWSDFKELLEQLVTTPPAPPRPAPPVPFAYSGGRAVAVANQAESSLRLELEFDVQVLETEAWVQVPVLPEGVAVASARLDGAPARMFRSGGFYNLALRGFARHSIALVVLVPTTENRGHRTARLRFPELPSVDLELRLPRDDLEVQLPGAVTRAESRRDGQTVVNAALEQSRDLGVTWFRQVSADDKSSKVFAEVGTLLQVGEGVVRGSTGVALTIHGRGVDELRLRVPAAVTVLDLSGHGITSWELEPDAADGARVLAAALNFRARGEYQLQLSFEQSLGEPGEDLLLPDLEVLDVLRERGFVAIAAATNVEITPRPELENAAPVDPAELPPSLAARAGDSVLYAFKYLRHPVRLAMAVEKHGDVAVKRTIVETARLHSFVNGEGRRLTSAVYDLKNNRKQYLAVDLPAGAVLWGAYREGRPIKAAERADGVILVPLRKTAEGRGGELRSFAVEVVYFEEGSALRAIGRQRLAAPRLDVDTMELSWQIHLPRHKRYLGFTGNLEPRFAANRIALVGGAAYNLENAHELELLQSFVRGGRTIVSDGANEVALDKVLVQTEGEDRPLAADELERIQKTTPRATPPPAPEIGAEQEEARRADEPAQQMMSQVIGASNVAQIAGLAEVGGGQMVGVLPVHFEVPSEGLRLSFGARLLTAEQRPELGIGHIPASWRVPHPNRFWVVVLVFGLGLFLGILGEQGLAALGAGNRVAAAVAAVFLVVLWILAEGHRVAFVVAAVAAFVVLLVVWSLRDRRGMEGF